jgi:hypothetical protein
MTSIKIDDTAPFAARIFVNDLPVIYQPYNPEDGSPWASKDEAEMWALETAQKNIDAGVWPPLG